MGEGVGCSFTFAEKLITYMLYEPLKYGLEYLVKITYMLSLNCSLEKGKPRGLEDARGSALPCSYLVLNNNC